MKHSISNIKSLLTSAEKLSAHELCFLKGGGEDLRRSVVGGASTVASVTTSVLAISISSKV